MMKTILILIVVTSVWSDVFLYRNYLKNLRLLFKWLFVGLLAVVNAAIVFFTIKYLFTHSKYSLSDQVTLLWVMYAFFAVYFPKMAAVVTLLIGRWSGRWEGRRKRIFSVAAVLVWGLVLGAMIEGVVRVRHALRVEHVVIESPKIPAGFDGYKIALFSDVHIGNIGDDSPLLTALADSLNASGADIAISCGDLVNTTESELTPKALDILGSIKIPVYSVMGNHDLGYLGIPVETSREENIARIIRKLNTIGWKTLYNDDITLHRGSDSISLIGVNSYVNIHSKHYKPELDEYNITAAMDDVPKSTFNILLSHNPQNWDSVLLDYPHVDLMLSGHTHSMQMRFGNRPFALSPAMLSKYWSGLYRNENRYLYITDGIGYVLYPMRIGAATPELTVIELKRVAE